MTGKIMVLVIEDDHLIQVMVEETLSDGGFESTIKASGEEAVALLRENKIAYRAVVSDVNLAGKLDGWEVARVAREGEPAMPVVYMTGAQGEGV